MEKEKKKSEPKEHKKNWREAYASVEEIQEFLSDRIMLRYNVVTRRVECWLVERSLWDSRQNQETTREWQPVNDRIVNSL